MTHRGGGVKGKLANGVGSQYTHATSERGISSITKADAHALAASSRLNWRPPTDLNGLVRFGGKTKSGFCACAITFRTNYTTRRRKQKTVVYFFTTMTDFNVLQVCSYFRSDQPRGLVVRASDYWSRGPGFDSRLYHGNFPWGVIPVVTMVWVVSIFRLKVETSSTRSQKSINSGWTYERDLLAGGDLITLGSLQVRLPDSQHISL